MLRLEAVLANNTNTTNSGACGGGRGARGAEYAEELLEELEVGGAVIASAFGCGGCGGDGGMVAYLRGRAACGRCAIGMHTRMQPPANRSDGAAHCSPTTATAYMLRLAGVVPLASAGFFAGAFPFCGAPLCNMHRPTRGQLHTWLAGRPAHCILSGHEDHHRPPLASSAALVALRTLCDYPPAVPNCLTPDHRAWSWQWRWRRRAVGPQSQHAGV